MGCAFCWHAVLSLNGSVQISFLGILSSVYTEICFIQLLEHSISNPKKPHVLNCV